MALNAKQKLFIQEYLKDGNATQAAKAAGYSERTAYSKGHNMLKHVEIAKAIADHKKREARYQEIQLLKLGMSKDRWLEELAILAGINIDDVIRVEEVEVKQGKSGKSYTTTKVTPIPTDARPRELGRAIKKISETKNGIGIELHSKQAALEALGRHFGWLKNDVFGDLPLGAQVTLTMPTNGREAVEEKPEVKEDADEKPIE
jgi:phage terminase small subunit